MFFMNASISYFIFAKVSLITDNIKDGFDNKIWCQKTGILSDMFTWIIEIFAIKAYLIIYTNFKKLISAF